ncbi:MAG: 50S ribosomal protein L29 [Promethearchaeota archaeon]
MAKLNAKEIRKMSKLEREKKLKDLYDELLLLQSKNSMGGALDNPSRIRVIKKAIARIKTINREDELNINIKK